jgi:hypothetical protein
MKYDGFSNYFLLPPKPPPDPELLEDLEGAE